MTSNFSVYRVGAGADWGSSALGRGGAGVSLHICSGRLWQPLAAHEGRYTNKLGACTKDTTPIDVLCLDPWAFLRLQRSWVDYEAGSREH